MTMSLQPKGGFVRLLRNVALIIMSIVATQYPSTLAFAPKNAPKRQVNSPIFLFPGLSSNSKNQERIAFVVEELGVRPADQVFEDIADMCINVFFNNGCNSQNGTPPWKQLQLAYLRSLQSSDLSRRRMRSKSRNAMFVARRAVPMSSPEARTNTPLILDMSTVYNLSGNISGDADYVTGEIIGFCEVTLRFYGLPNDKAIITANGDNDNTELLRPVLTNLSVAPQARKSGVGTQLVEACEQAVKRWQLPTNEVFLEVEDDNPSALRFYEKRGYQQLFADPASRRFDVSGFLLQKVRCTKICMRKRLDTQRSSAEEQVKATFSALGSKMLQTLRDSVFLK